LLRRAPTTYVGDRASLPSTTRGALLDYRTCFIIIIIIIIIITLVIIV